MYILKQAFTVFMLAFIIGLAVNFIGSDGISLFSSSSDDLFSKDKIKQISIVEAQKLLKSREAFFIDLRPTGSFNISHIHGSVNFPTEIIYGMLAKFVQHVPMEGKIILYGIDKKETGPSEVASLLQMMGYSSIYIMTEGWSGWDVRQRTDRTIRQ